ncbi:MAG TPA: hypothetical protein PKL61_17480, partial [Accumulibacter sp.]|uniref:hypothetical protein n=1 Tax=Accumulibacter sp. TaxID=2053492 RepID=UPI002C9CC072
MVAAIRVEEGNYLDYYTNFAKRAINTDVDLDFVKNAIRAKFAVGSDIENIRGEYFDDGSSTEIIEYTDGRTLRTNLDENGTVTSRASIQTYEEDGSRLETVRYADGRVVKLRYDGDGRLLSQQEIETGGRTLQAAIGQYGGTLLDSLSLVKAIQSGQPLPVVASGLRLANDLSTHSGAQNLNLSGSAYAASGILSLLSLSNALERGDALGALTAGAQAVTFGATAYASFIGYSGDKALSQAILQKEFGAAGDALGAVSKALPYLSLINSIAQGDMTGAVVAAVDLVLINAGVYAIPYIGWAYAIYSIVRSLFSDEPEIPDPWGNGQYVWNGDGITYQAAGETGGKEAVEHVLNSTLTVLNALIEGQREQSPGSPLGLIPNRLPSVGYDRSGYRTTDIDPLTGAEKHPALRFDTSGRPYNAEPGSPESYQSIVEGMVRSALARGAIAPLWEVQTARKQTDAGDPQAGLSEEERAGRAGQLAAPLTGARQTFRPVALDLDG